MNEALDHRLQGLTYREISKIMRISTSTAHAYITDALKEIPRANAEAVLTQQLERYDMLLSAFMPAALEGDTFAAQQCFAALAQISRLNGVESPVLKDAAEGVQSQLASLRQAAIQHFGLNDDSDT